jgi:hypothetical protein
MTSSVNQLRGFFRFATGRGPGFSLIQLFKQSRLAPGGIVAVEYLFPGGFIQGADRYRHRGAGGFKLTGKYQFLRPGDIGLDLAADRCIPLMPLRGDTRFLRC